MRRRPRGSGRPASAGLQAYVIVQFVIALALGIVFLVRNDSWPPAARWTVAGFVVVSLVACGGLLERKRWAVPLEIARLVAAVPLVHAAARRSPDPWVPAHVAAVRRPSRCRDGCCGSRRGTA